MNLLLMLFSIIFFLSVGYMIINFFELLKKYSIVEKISLSWGLGIGSIAMQMFLYNIAGIEWSRPNILLPWIIFVLLFIYKYKFSFPKKPSFSGLNNSSKIIIVLITILLTFTAIEAVIRPVQAWDAWSNWIFRPKVFFLQNKIDTNYFSYAQDDYPLILPLMGTFSYIMMGGIDDRLILLNFYMFYSALGGVFLYSLKKYTNLNYALLFTFLLLSLQNLIRHGGRFEIGQADLPLGYFIFSTTSLLLNYIKTKNIKILILLTIFLGLTAQIKNDAVAFYVIANIVLLWFMVKSKLIKHIPCLTISLLILLPWQFFKILNNIPANFLLRDGFQVNLDRIGIVFISMTKEFINFQNWNLLWAILVFSIAFNFKYISKIKILLTIFTFIWLGYFFVFLFTPREPAGHIANIIDRLYLHITPLAVFIIALLMYNIPIIKKYFRNY